MAKIGKILTIVGILLTAVLVLAIMTFMFGACMFFIVGEGDWFPRYVALNGYYGIINMMFLLDYIALLIGSYGILFLIPGIILSVIGKSKEKKAQQAQQNNQYYQQNNQYYQQNNQNNQNYQQYPPYQNR